MNNLTIDINGTCNEQCRFCYQDLDGSVLSEEVILRAVDEAKSLGVVEIGGGEPFLDKRIVQLIKNIRESKPVIFILIKNIYNSLIINTFLDRPSSPRPIPIRFLPDRIIRNH